MSYIKPKSIQAQQEEYTKTREVLNLFNRFCDDQKMPDYKIYRNLIQEETNKLTHAGVLIADDCPHRQSV